MNFGEQIWCTLSDKMSFELFSAIWSHINGNEKKLAKIQNLEFTLYNFIYLYITLVETIPRSMQDLFVVNLFCNFRRDVV